MKVRAVSLAEWTIAILMTGTVLALLLVRAQHAGGLWRDECASVQLAEMPTVSDLLHNFQRESFPAAFPLIIRGYGAIFGTSDVAFRTFGVAVGVLLLIVLWTNSLLLAGNPPLVSLALLGFNTTFLIWGTTIRGYGLGSVMILLTFGLTVRMLDRPTRPRIVAALLAAVASVQFLLYNSVILAAIALAVVLVCVVRRSWRAALAITGIVTVSAVSMLPYVGPFWNESRSAVVLRSPFDLERFWSQLQVAFGNPSRIMPAVWVALLIAAMVGAIVRLCVLRPRKPAHEQDALFFGLLVSAIAVAGYLVFLKILSYGTREWYYLALLSILAGTIDFLIAILSRFASVRYARVALVAAAAIAMPVFAWPKIIQRQTNLDLVARKLEEVARPVDLIVANPWYFGVTFNWYYHGSTPWITVPMMSDHRVHRFDLIKAKLISPNAIDDVYESIAHTLQLGNRVWFVGGVEFLPAGESPITLPPAPNPEFGWNMDPYAELWSQQIGVFLRLHSSGGPVVSVPTGGPVNDLENVGLLVIQGWHE